MATLEAHLKKHTERSQWLCQFRLNFSGKRVIYRPMIQIVKKMIKLKKGSLKKK